MLDTMRQRLLLAAGWLLAAVGSVAVASGAVAVAGGQVLDRPLHPLTAAEVANLPVGQPIGLGEPSGEALASGSLEPTAESDRESGPPAPRAGGQGGASAATGVVPPTDLDPVARPEESESRVVAVAGGRLAVAARDDAVTLLWAAPAPGYVATVAAAEPEFLAVTFTGGPARDVVVVRLVDGELVVEAGVEPLR
ncbi:MAG TPA: hypothetical protein ENK55_00775 [Actinobacteria bacterium]|nr:hypothetical protein [Actinomycetota bacterium]